LQKENDGLLYFDWDMKLYKDQLESKPKYETKTLCIIGPIFEDKTVLIKKLLMLLDDKDINSDASHERLKIGVSRILTNNGKINFLELWDISSSTIETFTVKKYLHTSDLVMFLIDGNDTTDESFRKMKELYHKSLSYQPKKRIICLTKKNTNNNSNNDTSNYNNDNKDNNHETTSHSENIKSNIQEQLKLLYRDEIIQSWAEQHDCEFLTIDVSDIQEIRQLKRHLMKIIDKNMFFLS
jgi:hypothetical protein